MFNINTDRKKRQDALLGDSGLRYYLHDSSSEFRFTLAGALAGSDVPEIEQCWRTAASTFANKAFVVDLSGLTAVDQAGRHLLHLWSRHGAQFRATSAHGRLLVESIAGHPLPPISPAPQASAWLSPRLALILSVAFLPLLLPITVWAVDTTSVPSPEVALARYNAGLEQNNERIEGRTVIVDIDASLPRLAKHGRLQAIRSRVPFARPQYQVVEMTGDRTVARQVIARYLTAEAQALMLPASSVAVSMANYKFHYVGSIGSAATLAYVFRITPRKKRVGLIRGELWIDAGTAIAVHEAGMLVKQPSVFLRRIDMIQDTDLRDGRPYLRITHLGIETRLVGPGRNDHQRAPEPLSPGSERYGRTGGYCKCPVDRSTHARLRSSSLSASRGPPLEQYGFGNT